MSSARRRSLLAVVVVALWSLLAVSCGGEVTKAEYGRQLSETMADLEEAYGDTNFAVEPGADATNSGTLGTVDDLRRSQLAIRDAGNRLDSITPPDELADDHAALVAGVRDMADAVDLLIAAQEQAETDPDESLRLAREFATDDSFTRVEAAASRIESAGVDAGL